MNKLLKYNQAKYAVFDIIAEKRLKIGEKLPSVRAMDSLFQYQFSAICLRRALDELSDQGYLEKRPGSGIYLARPIEAWNREGEMLYLEVASVETSVPAGVSQMKKYLAERNITLKSMTCIKPGAEILKAAENAIGIFASGWVTREWVDFLKALEIPVMYIGLHEHAKGLPAIDYDWQEATVLLMEKFIDRGYKKIGLINGDRGYYPSTLIAESFLQTARKNKLLVTEEDILWKPAFSSGVVKDFLDGHQSYDAVIIEAGALVHVLIYAYQYGLPPNCVLGALRGFANNMSTERMTFIAFEEQNRIYENAARVFFESLNEPDYFKSGPMLLKPFIIPEEE